MAKKDGLVTLTVNRSAIRAAIDALRFKAHDDAAHSQEPSLFDAEETHDWMIADYLEHALRQED